MRVRRRRSHVTVALATQVTCVKESIGAVFDKSGVYRYRLWRHWDPALPKLCLVMLNPSTADASNNDPTIARCVKLARDWGYGGVEVVNLFAYRATSPRDLWQSEDPVGPSNDRYIKHAAAHTDACVVAWGNLPPTRIARAKSVLRMLSSHKLLCPGVTKLSHPRHPLYLSSDALLEQFAGYESAAASASV